MRMSKKGAARRTRKMWRWIGEQSLREKRIVDKSEYFVNHKIFLTPVNLCYCCEYDYTVERTVIMNGYYSYKICSYCPLKWGTECDNKSDFCVKDGSPYEKIHNKSYSDYKEYAELCFKISRLPLRKEDVGQCTF